MEPRVVARVDAADHAARNGGWSPLPSSDVECREVALRLRSCVGCTATHSECVGSRHSHDTRSGGDEDVELEVGSPLLVADLPSRNGAKPPGFLTTT